MQRSPRSTSPPQSPIDPHDREQDRGDSRRARQDPSRSPPSARIPQGISTSLPSIRNLHLPPPHAQRHAVPAQHYSPEFPPSASYGLSTFFAGNQRSPVPASAYPSAHGERRMSFDRAPTAVRPQPSSSAYPDPRVSPPEGESDQEQNDSERGPPKKKRRRQALSCTECKRRKIKCDRTHPCGPCSRRSEPEKCQWHVIEPVAHGAFRPAGVSYSDKYVTRAEWDDLYARYHVLEERCIRLEKIVLQLHPELAESPSYEIATRHPATMPSPRAPHLTTSRAYPISGPGVSTFASNTAPSNQRVTPHTPVSALPGPSPSPHHGPGSSFSSLPVVSNTGAESAAEASSEPVPQPMHATTQTRATSRPPYSDRRTSATGLHTSFAATSERSVPHQVTETAHGRPFTAPTSHSYTLPPPPPPPEGPPPSYSPRRHTYSQGRSAAAPDPPSLPSPMPRATRLHGRPYPSPLSAVSTSRHMHLDEASAESMHEDVIADNHGHYGRDTRRHERTMSYEMPEHYRERDMDPKNGKAQAFEADDVLRHRWSASSSSNPKKRFSPPLKREYVDPDLTISPVLRPSSRHTHSGRSVPPSPCIDSPEISRSQRKRVRSGSLYLSLPSCGSAPESPPPAVVVH